MNIAAPGPSLLHIATSASELRARGLDLRIGQRLSGVVLATSGDRAVVDLGGTVVVARTALPLREGQAFTVSVTESRSDLVVLRLVADGGTDAVPIAEGERGAQSQAIARALAAAASRMSRASVQRALLAAGVSPTPESLEAAEALAAQGLPLTPRNIDFIIRRLDAFVGPRQEVARALAVARALDLPPTEGLVALLRQGLPEAAGPALVSRLADIEALATQALEALPSPPAPTASAEQVLDAVVSALSDAAESLPTDVSTSAARLTRALSLPADTWPQTAILAHEVDTAVRAMPAGAPDVWPQVTAALLSAVDGLQPAIKDVVVATAGPPSDGAEARPAERVAVAQRPVQPSAAGTGPALPAAASVPSGEGLRELAGTVLTHLRNLSLLIGSDTAAPQAVENALRALRNTLEPYLPPQGSPPPTLASELAQHVESLLARVDSRLSLEPPQNADQVRELLTAALARLVQNIPGQPPDRLQVLAAVVERSRELLGPSTGWEPPPVRALARELADVARMFTERAAGTQVREAVAEGVERLTDVLALAEAASRVRRSDLLTLFVGRAVADVASVVARHIEGLLRWSTQAASATGPAPPAAGPLSEPAAREALRELLLVVGEEVRPRLEGVLELLGSPARQTPPQVAGPTTGRALNFLLELVTQAPLAGSEPDALPPPVRQALADARPAVVFGSVEAVRSDLGRLVHLLARLVMRPTVPGSDAAEAVRMGTDVVATSAEAKLLGPDPPVRMDSDLRTALARVAQSAERADAAIRTVGPQPGPPDLPARLVEVANAARAAGSVVEAQQLVHLAGARLSTPVVAYIHVPVVVGQERRLAEFKVLRDPRRRAVDLDPSDMTVALRLDTATLGLVVIVMRSRDGVLDLKFTLERPEYQRAVSRELPDLRHSLDEAGFSVAGIAAEVRRDASAAFAQLGAPGPEGASISILA